MYKAVFIDLDGTLLRSDHSVSDATIRAIEKLKEKNMLVVLVSARPLHGILAISDKVGLSNFPVASLNGAYIVSKEEVIFESAMDIDTAVSINEYLNEYDATAIYYQQLNWFAQSLTIHTDHEQVITEVPLIVQPFADTLQFWQKQNAGPNKILVIAEPMITVDIQSKLKTVFKDRLNIYHSKPNYLELMNEPASKTNAVKFLINRYNISKEETIAIGDNFNDLDMIDFAGTGIAMGHAPAEVKAVANYVTETNDNDGVARALGEFIGL